MTKKKVYFSLLYLIISTLIVLRNHSLYPSVMGDEFMHSLFSRNARIDEISIPSYLYYFIYKSTNYCGENFLNCARIINYLFYSLGSYFIYLICLKTQKKNYSIYIFFITLILPYNAYTAYFIPESMFFCFFWLYIYTVFSSNYSNKKIILIGLILGILSLIKPHAIFLLPSIIAFLFLIKKKNVQFIIDIFIIIIFFFSIKIFLYIFYNFSFEILGKFYNNSAINYIDIEFKEVHIVVKKTLINLFGTWSFLLITFSVPLLDCFKKTITFFDKKPNNKYLQINLLSFLTIVTITTIYSIFAGFDIQDPLRINFRYSFFIIPLLFLVLIDKSNSFNNRSNNKTNKIFTLLYFIIIISFCLNVYPSFHLVDNPLYRAIIYNQIFLIVVIFTSSVLVILANFNYRLSLNLYLYFFLPLIVIISTIPITKELLYYKKPSITENLSLRIKESIKNKKNEQILITNYKYNNKNSIDVFKMLFTLDNKNISLITLNHDKNKNFIINEQFFVNAGNNNNKIWSSIASKKSALNLKEYDYHILILNNHLIKQVYTFNSKTKKIKNIFNQSFL